MKYNKMNQIIPQEKRKELNDKILYLINNDLTKKFNITNEIIYNSYTGDGGLHGLNYKDFSSYYEYSEAKKDFEAGQFFTGHKEAKYLCECLGMTDDDIVFDITCGMGNMFNFVLTEHNCFGTELDINAYKVCKHLYPKANIVHGDMRKYNPSVKAGMVIIPARKTV